MSHPSQQAAPDSAPSYGREQALMDQFRQLAARYEISDTNVRRLRQLEGFEIVLILDDSGSMNTPLRSSASMASSAGAFAPAVSRWEELKHTVGIVVDIASVMDKDGLDIYFLNRATVHGVTSSAQLSQIFAAPPSGLTPIAPVLQHVLQAKRAAAQERKLLLLIATDGAPTNANGDVDTEGVRQLLVHARNADTTFVTFLVATDDGATVAYLNEWDRKIKHLDVVDDYHSERAEVLKAQGQGFHFSFGDYIVKALLGAIDPYYDALDQTKGGCCSVQ